MRQKLSLQERKVIIIGLLSLLVAAVTYGVLSSSGAFKNQVWNLGGAIVGFLASVVALNRVYGKGFRFSREEREQPDTSKVEISPPSIQLINGSEEITDLMIQVVQGAQKYIYTIGGRSNEDLYLDALREKVLRGNVRYVRVITGENIPHPLCRHLHELQDAAEIGYLKTEKYGNVLVTDSVTFLALPSPNVPVLDKGLRVVDERIAADYRAYVVELLGRSKKDISLEFVRSLCKSCNKKNA